ncbi:iron ABC transporter permease [Treponema sp. OMZ 305]|uniref:FecCD family ABC transporter permease n=1 Tax=Treponema sp. OMZ 305 TaxID=1659192 RepID=UPI0020A3229E|nr:iron ABC transporter permease [Treponema sp. OMZ 305]UTC57126.1 iron ABC transporter permease [Treponema sp. OMZ 305]
MDSQNRTETVHPDIGSRIPEKAGSVGHTEDERFLREYKQSKRKGLIAFIAVIALLTLAFIASFCIGRYSISPARVLQSIGGGIKNGAGEFSKWGTAEDTVVWLVRMPRICAAMLVGAALAAAGATYQGLFRNPMVSPDILGASAGASVGACFMMLMNQSSAMIQAGAFVTGIIAVTLSYFLSKAIGRGSNMILLLVLCGMTVNTLFQAVVSIIKYLADTESQLPEMTYWLMGSIAKVSYRDLLFFLIPFAVGIVPIVALRWKLNVLSFGEDEAKAMGVNVGAVRVVCIICATLLTAAVVSVAGTIGWVGLMIPHLVRFLVGPNNKTLIPLSLLTGGLFMLIIDNFCRSLMAYEIPLGVLTSLLGAPFFIFILYKRRGAA